MASRTIRALVASGFVLTAVATSAAQRWGHEPSPREGVCFVRDPNFNGGGEDPDRIIRRAYQDLLHREPDEGGYRQYRSRVLRDGWSEDDVRNSIRSSPEYREVSTMTPAKAQEIVRRAYLSVLKREPDAGAQGFVDRVLRDHWTQQDVERELRRSPEYRERR